MIDVATKLKDKLAPAEKQPLLDELELLRAALSADHSGGVCLPIRTYWALREEIMAAKSFLRFRTQYKDHYKRG